MNYYFPDKTTSILKHHNFLQNVTTAGEPIDIATGDYLQQWQLIDLSNNLLPLKFTRVYRSTSEVCGHCNNSVPPPKPICENCQRITDGIIMYMNRKGIKI